MTRLPIPGSDDGQWGQILNDFLGVEHNTDGTLKRTAEIASKYSLPAGGIPESDLETTVQAKLDNVGTNVPPDGSVTDAKVAANAAIAQTKIASSGTPGNTLADDLAGKASATDYRLSNARIIASDGTNSSSRVNMNFKSGAGITITASDDSVNDQMNVQISATDPVVDHPLPWSNVMDYGAKGDGTTDDTAAFQSAIAAKGIIYCPRGTYLLSASLSSGGTVIMGDGPGITTLKWASDLGSSTTTVHAVDMSAGDIYGTAVRSLTLQGPSGSLKLGARQVWMNGIQSCGAALVRDVEITGFNAGLYVASDHERFEDLKMNNCYYGVYFGPSPTQGSQVFTNVDLTNNAFASMGIYKGGVSGQNGIAGGVNYTSVQFGYSPYGVYKESGGDNNAIAGGVFTTCTFNSCGNAVFCGGDVTSAVFLSCEAINPFDTNYQAPGELTDAMVKGNSFGWSRVVGNNFLSTPGNVAVIDVYAMDNAYFDDVTDGIDAAVSANKPWFAIKEGSGSTLFYNGARCSVMDTNSTYSRWTLMEIGADAWCQVYSSHAPVGVAVVANDGTVGGAILAHEGDAYVCVDSSQTVAAFQYLKPDPAHPGCAIAASGPQDGAVFGYSTAASDSGLGTVACYLTKCG